eukprot:6467096-Amphidinium_carterae.4
MTDQALIRIVILPNSASGFARRTRSRWRAYAAHAGLLAQPVFRNIARGWFEIHALNDNLCNGSQLLAGTLPFAVLGAWPRVQTLAAPTLS